MPANILYADYDEHGVWVFGKYTDGSVILDISFFIPFDFDIEEFSSGRCALINDSTRGMIRGMQYTLRYSKKPKYNCYVYELRGDNYEKPYVRYLFPAGHPFMEYFLNTIYILTKNI